MNTTLGTSTKAFFRDYLQNERNYSPHTISSYSDCLRLLFKFWSHKSRRDIDIISMDDITYEFISDFIEYLSSERGSCANTCNQRLAIIKAFCRYLARNNPEYLRECERICAIRKKEVPHKIIEGLSEKEVNLIIKMPETTKLSGARDHALLLFMYNTGARAQEIVDLKIGDISRNNSPQALITGKGRKQRVVPLWDETIQAITRYLTARGSSLENKNESVFLNAKGDAISRFGIGYLVDKYTSQAALQHAELADKHITPHTFRHTTALSLIRSGSDIVVVKEWLGHADIKTTMLYLEIDLKMRKEILENFPAPVSSTQQDAVWKQPTILAFLDELCRGHYVE